MWAGPIMILKLLHRKDQLSPWFVSPPLPSHFVDFGIAVYHVMLQVHTTDETRTGQSPGARKGDIREQREKNVHTCICVCHKMLVSVTGQLLKHTQLCTRWRWHRPAGQQQVSMERIWNNFLILWRQMWGRRQALYLFVLLNYLFIFNLIIIAII